MSGADGLERVTVDLDNDAYDRFLAVEPDVQRQLVYDAWRWTMQDWQYTRPEARQRIAEASFTWNDISLYMWEESDADPDPSVRRLQFDAADTFNEVDAEVRTAFVKKIGTYIEAALEARYPNVSPDNTTKE